jgi:hypothetical protein
MLNAVSSFGAPRKIDGIKSMKQWVIVIDIMKIAKAIGERKERNNEALRNKRVATRFM